MKKRESLWQVSSNFCLCNCCGKVHSNCPFEMSMVEDIINEIRNRPELWMSKHPRFKHNRAKGKMWDDIASKLKIEGDILKKHWKYLRNQFKKELSKCSGDDGEQQVSSWKYFDQLSFLREEIEENSSDLNKSMRDEFEEPLDDSDRPGMREESAGDNVPLSFMRESLFSANDLPSNHPQESFETESIVTRFQDIGEDNSTIPMPSVSYRPRPSFNSQLRNSLQSEYSNSRVMMTELRGSKDDEDFFYFMSLLPAMKNLTNLQKMRFRATIEQFILDAVSINEYSSYMKNFNHQNSQRGQGSRKRNFRNARM